MIVSEISGIRSVPFYKISQASASQMHMESFRSFTCSKAPAFQVITKNTLSSAHIVSSSTTVLTPATSTMQVNGDSYNVYSFAESSVVAGAYHYELVISGVKFYSPKILVQSCSFDFEVIYSYSCDTYLSGTTSHSNKIELNGLRLLPTDTEGNISSVENGDGQEIVTSSSMRTVYAFEMLGSHEVFSRLIHISRFDNVKIKAFGVEYDVLPSSFKATKQGDSSDPEFQVRVEFQTQGIDTLQSCACDAYDNPDSGTNDIICANLNVSIDSSSFPSLSAVITGTPTTPREVKWYKDGVLFSTSEVITVDVSAATYELRVKVDGCTSKSAIYTHVNECANMEIQEQVLNGVLTANVINAPGAVNFEILDDVGAQASSSLPFTPTQSGTYTIRAVSGVCTKDKLVYIDVTQTDGCTHSAEIIINGEQWTANAINASGTIVYRWDYRGADNVLTGFSNEQIITPRKTGIYYANVIVDGCIKIAERLYIGSTIVEIANPINVILDNRYRHQLATNATHGFDGSFNYVEIRTGTLPNVSSLTDEQVNKRIQVFASQGQLHYASPTTFLTQFSVDNVNNRIVFHENIVQYEVVQIWYLEDLQ